MKEHPHNAEMEELLRRLEESEATLDAIRNGEVDALVVDGREIYTLAGADHPYRVLVEAMQQGAVTISMDGTIIYCNTSFANMAERPYEQVIGRPVAELFAVADRQLLRDMLAEEPSVGRQIELALHRERGTDMPVLVSRTLLPLDGTTAMCLVVTNLTEHKQNLSLVDSDRRKDEFLAMLAHELRNPLAPISNAVQMLCLWNKSDQANVRLACEIIERQVGQMSRIVDDLLDVSRITRGKINLQMVPTDVSAVVANAVETSRPLIESRKHKLQITLANEPLRVLGDITRLSQVLTNLLNNAAKYTPDGGQIWLSVERRRRQVAISVRDNGMGIPADMLPTIFELFTQAERTIDRSQGGLGIGLTLVRRLVDMHQGSVSVASAGVGQGSDFVVCLPLIEHADHHNGQARQATPLEPVARQRILVVDDNVDAARTLAMLLRVNGHTTEIAHDGLAALASVEIFEPSVILLDIGLPGMNGFVLAEKLRARPAAPRPMLVAITGYGEEQDRQRAKQAGFDHHFVKPVNFLALQEVLATVK